MAEQQNVLLVWDRDRVSVCSLSTPLSYCAAGHRIAPKLPHHHMCWQPRALNVFQLYCPQTCRGCEFLMNSPVVHIRKGQGSRFAILLLWHTKDKQGALLLIHSLEQPQCPHSIGLTKFPILFAVILIQSDSGQKLTAYTSCCTITTVVPSQQINRFQLLWFWHNQTVAKNSQHTPRVVLSQQVNRS